MSTSALPTFTTAVLSTFSAAPALAGVRIFDGPELDMTYPGNWIGVGHDGSDDGDVTAGTVIQEYVPIGAKAKYEDGTLECFLASQDGTTDLTARRTAAFNLLAAVENVVRADPSFGGVVLYSSVAAAQMQYQQTNVGVVVGVTFTLTYRARI